MTTIVIGIALVIAQANLGGETRLAGNVVDGEGKPIAGAGVFLSVGMNVEGSTPVVARTKTDDKGAFSFDLPAETAEANVKQGIKVWAYDGAKGFTGVYVWPTSKIPKLELVLERRRGRTFVVKGPGDKPIVGARIAPRVVSIGSALGGGFYERIPDELAELIAVTTNVEGKAEVFDPPPSDSINAATIDSSLTACQILNLTNFPSKTAVFEWKLEPAGSLAGSVFDQAGSPLAGRIVAIWARDENSKPAPVRFASGPIKTGADGEFKTPAVLLLNHEYRVFIQSEGTTDAFLSNWIKPDKPGDRTIELPPIKIGGLRSISGKVFDVRGNPVADAEVFQTCEGPYDTATRTAADGSFRLEGLRAGALFLFVRHDHFRFFGGLYHKNDQNIKITLVKTTEPPLASMPTIKRTLGDDERKRLARRLLDPCLRDMKKQSVSSSYKRWILFSLIQIDPAEVLIEIERPGFDRRDRDYLLSRTGLKLAETDLAEATTVVETISDADGRASALLDLIDAISAERHADRRALFDRALIEARASTKPQFRCVLLGDIAERLVEAGEIERARPLFEEGRAIAEKLPENLDLSAGLFAARLASIDYPAVMKIVASIPNSIKRKKSSLNVLYHAVMTNPDRAEETLAKVDDSVVRDQISRRFAARRAGDRPDVCERLAVGIDHPTQRAIARVFLARGLSKTDPKAAAKSFSAAVRDIDMGIKNMRYINTDCAMILPSVEEFDPAYVPEIFWRSVAVRKPDYDPRDLLNDPGVFKPLLLARYDRDVARELLDRYALRSGANSSEELSIPYYKAEAMVDPRRAVELIEALPAPRSSLNDLDGSNWLRIVISELLARSDESAWRTIWARSSGMGDERRRDVP